MPSGKNAVVRGLPLPLLKVSVNPGPNHCVKKHLRPYTFTQAQDDPEMTVVIDVPPETKTMDVKVKMTATTLYVSVKDHANQPVIEGRFLHAIRPEESAFHLEGSGEGRKLILDIEKASAGAQDWSPGLLVV